MTARTTIQSLSGATLAISATLPATYDAAGYGATTMVYTAIGQVDNFGKHGVTATITEFTAVADAVVQKLKGAKNYGTMSLSIGDIPSDAGQAILDTASESTAHYSVKVTYPLGGAEATNALHYLDVLVAKKENEDGAVNDTRKLAVDMAICRKPTVVAAT